IRQFLCASVPSHTDRSHGQRAPDQSERHFANGCKVASVHFCNPECETSVEFGEARPGQYERPGTQRRTAQRYSSYEAPNFLRSVGSSYSTTNRWKITNITSA